MNMKLEPITSSCINFASKFHLLNILDIACRWLCHPLYNRPDNYFYWSKRRIFISYQKNNGRSGPMIHRHRLRTDIFMFLMKRSLKTVQQRRRRRIGVPISTVAFLFKWRRCVKGGVSAPITPSTIRGVFVAFVLRILYRSVGASV